MFGYGSNKYCLITYLDGERLRLLYMFLDAFLPASLMIS